MLIYLKLFLKKSVKNINHKKHKNLFLSYEKTKSTTFFTTN